ncbi:MAG: putative toxin-antitoxin system toxin component, PIN family [Thermodesulfobacteriota bacterium]
MGKKKDRIKVVLDTNILLSALLFKKRTSEIVDLWKKEEITPFFTIYTFDEFKKALEYSKFSLTEDEIYSIIYKDVIPFFQVVEDTENIRGVCSDPDDDKFLSCAVSCKADFIVTGDKDLLILKLYKKVPILTPREFVELIQR